MRYPQITCDTPCDLCGDPLGMDSGHHVSAYQDDSGTYHVRCQDLRVQAELESRVKDLEGQLATAQRERDDYRTSFVAVDSVLLKFFDRPDEREAEDVATFIRQERAALIRERDERTRERDEAQKQLAFLRPHMQAILDAIAEDDRRP